MKNDPRRFAPLGLVLSLLAVISFFVIIIIKGLAGAGVFTLPDTTVLDKAIYVSLAVIVLGLAATAFMDPDGTRKFFVGRQVQYGSNSLIMLVAFLGVVFFVNLLAYQYPVTKDMTEDKTNSLAPETVKMLATLPQPVRVRAYYSTQVSKDTIQKLLDNFKQSSNGKLTYEFRDLYQDPYSAQQDGVTRDSMLVFQMGERKQSSTTESEEAIDTAILRLINPQSSVVYFVTGDGEHDTEAPGDSALNSVKLALQNKNYTVNLLNLKSSSSVPADAKAIIIAGPQQPLGADEVAVIKAYLDKGGSAIVMEDPPGLLPKFATAPDPLAELLTGWGVTLQDTAVIDPNVPNSKYVLADPNNYGQHPITASMHGINSAFIHPRSLGLANPAPDGITLTPLAQTLSNAWGETDYKNGGAVGFDPAKDVAGPVIVAAAAENATSKARLVVFGDSAFALDPFYQQGNGDMLINAVDWAANQQSLISLTPKNNIARTYQPPSTTGLIGIFLLSLCVIPLLVVVAGVAAWYSRRRRG